MARLDAKWDDFTNRGQVWGHFWQGTSSVAVTYTQVAQSQADIQQSYICCAQSTSYITISTVEILFLDTFSRTTSAPPFDVGSPDIGDPWQWVGADTEFTEATSELHVDGSELVTPGGATFDSMMGPPTIDIGEVQWDFWVQSSGDNSANIRWEDVNWWAGYQAFEDYFTLIGQLSPSDQWPVTRNAWHRFRVVVNSTDPDGIYVKAHLWTIGDPEPDTWTTLQTIWPVNYNNGYNSAPVWDFWYTSSNPDKYDNFQITTDSAFYYNQGIGYVQAQIRSFDVPQFGQALASINQVQQAGQAQADIHVYGYPFVEDYTTAENIVVSDVITFGPQDISSYATLGDGPYRQGWVEVTFLSDISNVTFTASNRYIYLYTPGEPDINYLLSGTNTFTTDLTAGTYYISVGGYVTDIELQITSPNFPIIPPVWAQGNASFSILSSTWLQYSNATSYMWAFDFPQWGQAQTQIVTYGVQQSGQTQVYIGYPPTPNFGLYLNQNNAFYSVIDYPEWPNFPSPTMPNNAEWWAWGAFTADVTGTWKFQILADYRAVLYIDGTSILDVYYYSGTVNTTIDFTQGDSHTIELYWYGDAAINGLTVWYQRPEDIDWYLLTSNNPPWVPRYYNVTTYAQAQSKLNSFGFPQYGQALAYIGHFQYAQTTVYISPAFDQPVSGNVIALITQLGQGLVRMIWTSGEYQTDPISYWSIEDESGEPNYDSDSRPMVDYPGGDAGAAWSARFIADETGIWNFATNSDDGSELYIDSTLVVENGWGGGHGETRVEGSISLVSGTEYNLHARWGQGSGPWAIRVQYERPSDSEWYYLTDNHAPWLWVSKVRKFAQANALIVPIPTLSYFGQTQARIRAYDISNFAQALALIGHQQFAQAQAKLNSFDQPHFAQSLAYVGHFQSGTSLALIRIVNISYMAQAQARITHSAGYGITLADIRHFNTNGYGQSRVQIGHWKFGFARCFIVKNKEFEQGQAQADILRSDNYQVAQTAVYIPIPPSAQAQVDILQTYTQSSNAGAILNTGLETAATQADIKQTYQQYAIMQADIKQTYSPMAQILADIRVRHWNPAQAMTTLSKQIYTTGQAMVWIGYHHFGQAQAQLRAYSVPKHGLAVGYILVGPIIPPGIGPSSDYQTYLVRFNGYNLPGYAQSESYGDTLGINQHYSYIDESLSEDVGLQNETISLDMLLWESNYNLLKTKVRRAATIMHSAKGFAPLYIQRTDQYYLAIAKSITVAKSVSESPKILKYTIEFEVKPQINTSI